MIRKVILTAVVLLVAMSAWAVPHLTEEWVREHYGKREVYVPMRDGVRLHMAVYEPADSLSHPVILIRTPYGVSPYGEKYSSSLRSWMRMFALNNYIIVFQSVRGTYLSEGTYENIRPLKPEDAGLLETDEATIFCSSFFLSTSLTIYFVPCSSISIHSNISLLLFNIFFFTLFKYLKFFFLRYFFMSYFSNSLFILFTKSLSLYIISIEKIVFDNKYNIINDTIIPNII